MIERITLKPPTPQLDASNILQLCDLYLAALKPKIAQSTHNALIVTLDRFRIFWTAHGPAVGHVLTPETLATFATWLESQKNRYTGEPLSYATRFDTLRRFRQCLRWAWRNEYLPSDWSRHVPAARGQATTHNALTLVELRAIWDQCFSSDNHLRDCALLALYAGTGARRAEIAGIRVEDIAFCDSGLSGLITVYDGKKRKDRVIAFDSWTGRYLKLYMDRVHPDFWLFPGRDAGGNLGDETIGRMFRKHAQAAGVSGFSGCHDFRRTFVTLWLQKLPGEGYAALLSRQVGHKHSTSLTTGLYNRLSSEDIRKVMEIKRPSSFAQMFQ